MTVPKEQRAVVRQGNGDDVRISVQTVPVKEPGPGEILVKIRWTGLCASDRSILYDHLVGIGAPPMNLEETGGIAGHEGAGEVVAVHPDSEHLWKVGDRAGVKWLAYACGTCEFCTNGFDEHHCPNRKNSARNCPGTFQEFCLTDAKHATRIPDGVSDEEAGPIMCAGATSYTALKRSGVRPGQWVVIPGAGGGLGHLGVQYARAMGMRPIAIDGGPAKRQLCLELGAEIFLDYTEIADLPAEIKKITTYGAHAVVVYAGSKASYATAPFMLRPRGTVVAVGVPHEKDAVVGGHPAIFCMGEARVVGSVVGTLKDVDEALDFVKRGLVKPILTKGTLEDVEKFCGLIGEGKVPGRVVLKVAE